VQLVAADYWTGTGAIMLHHAALLRRWSGEPARSRQTGDVAAQRARALGTLRLPPAAALDPYSSINFLASLQRLDKGNLSCRLKTERSV
jgi:hypothetical protein